MAKIKFESFEHALNYVNSLPIQEIVQDYARLLWEGQSAKVEPIRLTEAQFKAMFRIIGQTQDGDVERRGRKPKQI